MIKHLVVLTALAFSTVAVAHADQISGYVNANGSDAFNSSSITFTPNTSNVQGAIGGTFGTYLTDGDAVNFINGSLPYTTGANTAPSGLPPLFTVAGKGETFAFNIASYNANYVTDGTLGCTSGTTCLLVTGLGNFTGTGVMTFDATPATFVFSSQYSPNQAVATMTTFSSSASATPSPVPEPASLALFGTGLLGVVGLARRKFNV